MTSNRTRKGELKTEISIFDTVNKTYNVKEIIKASQLYVYGENKKIKSISTSDENVTSEQTENQTQKMKQLVSTIKAINYFVSRDLKEFLVLDDQFQLHFIDQQLEKETRKIKLTGYAEIDKLKDIQIAAYTKHLFILNPQNSEIHVFNKEKGEFIKTIDISEVSKFASLGIEDKKEQDKIVHPNILTANEPHSQLFVYGNGWNGIYSFSFREGLDDNKSS